MSSLLDNSTKRVFGATAAAGLLGFAVFKLKQRYNAAAAKQRRAAWQRTLVDEAAAQLREMGLRVLSSADEDEAVAVQVRSFSGSANTQPELANDWICGPELRGKWDDPLRITAVRHGMLWCFRNTIVNGGVAIGVPAKDGRLGAVCLTCPMISEDNSLGGFLENPIAMPPWPFSDHNKYGKFPELRAAWLYGMRGNLLDRLHKQYAPGPHWYVNIMAVDPSAQGQGLAARALRAVNTLADKAGVPCFLDTCGERNRSIYERVGYKACGGRGFELNVPGDPDPIKDPTEDSGIIRHYGMLRSK